MAHEHSAQDLEVARILRMLPHLVWEAQHPRPYTHDLRWGARKRRSAWNDEARPPPTHSPAVAPPSARPRPPLHHPAAAPTAAEKLSKKRIGDHTKPCRGVDASEEKAATAMAAAPETSSPETPLDFWPSGEDADAGAKPRPSDQGRALAKKPKSSNCRELAKRLDLLIHTRTELQKEAVEAKTRLETERWKYYELVDLRIKLEEATHHRHHQQQILFDLPPMCTVRSTPGVRGDPIHPNQPYQHDVWPKNEWTNNYSAVHEPTTAFSLCSPLSQDHKAAAPAGKPHCDWAASQPLGLAGNQGGSRLCNIPDLNTRADEELAWI